MYSPLQRHLWIVLLAVVMTCRLQADPPDMSIESYEKAQEEAHKEALTYTERSLKNAIASYDAFSTPYRPQDRVTIVDRRGRRIDGTYYRMTGGLEPIITIADMSVNLSDLNEVDRERFIWGRKPEAEFKVELEKRRSELLRMKESRYDVFYSDALVQRGYSKAFMESALPLGDRFWRLADLGNGGGRMVVEPAPLEVDPYGEFYLIRVANPVRVPSLMVVMLGGKAVGASYPTRNDIPELKADTNWTTHEFLMKRDDLDDPNPEAKLPGSVRMVVFVKGVGTWEMAPNLKLRPQDEMRANFRFSFVPKSIDSDLRNQDKRFSQLVQDSRQYQSIVEEIRQDDLKRFAKEASANTSAALKVAQNQALKQKRSDVRERLLAELQVKMQQWFSRDNPPESEMEKYLSRDVIYGSADLPMKIGVNTPGHLSPWIIVPDAATRNNEDGQQIVGVWYRFVELLRAEGADPAFLWQFRIFYLNSSPKSVEYKPEITVNFAPPEGIPAEDWLPDEAQFVIRPEFSARPIWNGYLLGTQPVTLEQVMGTVASVKIVHYPKDAAKDVEATDDGKPADDTVPAKNPAE